MLRNTLESGFTGVYDSVVVKKARNGLDSCSTNITGDTANFEEQCQEFQDDLAPCMIK